MLFSPTRKGEEPKIQKSDSVILLLPELAARPRNLAALSHRGIRSHGIESTGAGRDVAIPPRHAERRATADPFRLKERARSDHFARGDRKSGHVHRHAQVRRRAVSRVSSRSSGRWLYAIASYVSAVCYESGYIVNRL